MNDELVNTVVRRVMAELAKEKPTSPAGRRATPPPASAAEPETPAAPERVWLTAGMLADRAGGARAVTLGANEYLTPAAGDFASSGGIEVMRQPVHPAVTPASAGQVKPAALTKTLGLVVYRPDAKVEAALAAASRNGVVTRGFAQADCWMVNTRAMCGEIVAGALAGGVIIDRYAAAAVVLAAKIPGIRPVQGVSVQAVEAALRQFDANVLVIGCVNHSVYELRSMIDRFSTGRRMGRGRTVLLDEVAQLEAGDAPCESPE